MKNKKRMNRRDFLETSAVTIAGAGLFYPLKGGFIEEKDNKSNIKIKAFRMLGRTGFKASDIGAGKPFNVAVLKALMDAGINYIDTAESYGRGQSEKVIGEAIKGRDRKSLFINSKLSMRGNPTKEQILSRARKCLERLKTEYLDCMMIHSCQDVKMVNYKPFHDAMRQLKNEGKLRFVGLSNHGEKYRDVSETMEKVCLAAVKNGSYDHMLMVYNFLKWDMGEKILKACHGKNIGTTLMKVNPVGSYYAYKSRLEEAEKDGKPTERIRDTVERFKKRMDLCQDFIQKHKLTDRESIRTAAYRFVLKNRYAHSALYHFSNFDEMDSMIGISGTGLTTGDQKTLALLSRGCHDLYCRHACGICESHCPKGVPVNTIMRYNHYFEAQKQEKYAMQKYDALSKAKAEHCYSCAGFCEKKCPYGLPIQGLLIMAHKNLTLS